jgi:hypothetical protein
VRYFRRDEGCIRLNHIKNENIREGLKLQSVQNKIDGHKEIWINHLVRRTDGIISKQTVLYKTKERRDSGRPWEKSNEYV